MNYNIKNEIKENEKNGNISDTLFFSTTTTCKYTRQQ